MMADEATTPSRRGRKRLKEGPPIITLDSGRRAIRVKAGGKVRLYPIENYCLVNARTLEEVIGRLSAPEIRHALDQEWASPTKRLHFLLRLSGVMYTQQKREALDAIRRNVPAQIPRLGRKHTVSQIEVAALRTFDLSPRMGKPRYRGGASYRSTLTKKMRQRRAEYEQAAIDRMKAGGRDKLTKREREALRKQAGDHFHDGMTAGQLCELCGEIIEEQVSW